MTGVDIIGELLRPAESVVGLPPAPQVKAGALPENTPLPALLVRLVSLVDRQPLKRSSMVRSIARVSVTVRAATYREQVVAIKAVRRRCAGWTGDIAGAQRVSILTAGTGPDMRGPGNTFEQTQDFRVSFDAPA